MNKSAPECVAIYMLRGELIRTVGLFDEDYYMYGEDNDYFFRCEKAGYHTVQTNIPVWHKGEGFSTSEEQQREVTKLVYRNWLRLALKNYGAIQILVTVIKMTAYAMAPTGWRSGTAASPSVRRLVRFERAFRIKCLIASWRHNLRRFNLTQQARRRDNLAQRGAADLQGAAYRLQD